MNPMQFIRKLYPTNSFDTKSTQKGKKTFSSNHTFAHLNTAAVAYFAVAIDYNIDHHLDCSQDNTVD